MSSTPHDPFYSSPFGPFYRRHTPYMVQPEYRIYEMNKRLQSRTEVRTSTLGVCCCLFFFFFLHTPNCARAFPAWLAASCGKCPARSYRVRGNERQDEATSLNAGFLAQQLLEGGDSFWWNLEIDNPALDSPVGSPEMLSQNSGVLQAPRRSPLSVS